MDDIRDIPRDDILDLSYLPKEHESVNKATCYRIRDHVAKRTQTRKNFAKIVSCYRSKNQPGTFFSCHDRVPLSSFDVPEICSIVFPLWILAVLNPNGDETLSIAEVTVAHFDVSIIPQALDAKPSRLIINKLNVACENYGSMGHTNYKARRQTIKQFLQDHHIKYENIELVPLNFDDTNIFSRLTCIETTSHQSPHIMFGSCCGISNVSQPLPIYGDRFKGDGILIATLGYGYNKYPFLNSDEGRHRPITVFQEHLAVLSSEDSKSQEPKTYDHWITSPWIIHDYTKTSEFIVCQTTDPDGFVVNGATAKALKYLRVTWEEQKGNYDNLVVLIPYGGQYMEDEMKEIYEATNEGIIIVCAAGREGGDVVFPAALGTVISVGVAGTGPKGREIDVSIDFETRPAKLLNSNKEVELPRDCGIAAARVAGLISLLLSHINSIMKAPGKYTENPIKNMAMHIRDSKPSYLHTYVIRELIVNEGNGSHDPQLGYGDGEQIILSLLDMDPSFLIQKLANIICGQMNTEKGDETEGDKIRAISEKFHDLKGENIEVGIIDDFKVAPQLDSTEKFKWQLHPKDLHGDKCAMVLRNISSDCQIWCLNTAGTPGVDSMVRFFEACISEEYKAIDVISCSVGFPCFHLGLCTAVDNAVKAGKIIVFAAGNCGLSQQNSIFYPGRNGNIIVVGRGDGFYNRARYSSAGREMDFLAQVQCVKPNKASSGTSFAAPVVAGYIALLLGFIQKEMEHNRIEVWSGNEWKNIPVSEAARNVYAMRALLKLLVVKPQVHSETEGFGCLNFSALFPEYDPVASAQLTMTKEEIEAFKIDAKAFSTALAKKRVLQTLKKFYKRGLVDAIYIF